MLACLLLPAVRFRAVDFDATIAVAATMASTTQ